MNTARQLIDQYKTAVAEEESLRQHAEQELTSQALERFGLNCRAWLGPLWNEFTIGEFSHYRNTSHNANEICFTLKLSFLGANGAIFQSFDMRRSRWETARLSFGNLSFPDGKWKNAEIHLCLDENGNASPPNPRDMGSILARLEEYEPIRQENERLWKESRKRELLNFDHRTRSRIESHLAEGLKEFPELADQLTDAAGKALRELDEAERKRQEENQHYADVIEERKRLQELAHLAWRKPFTLYMVTYGASIENGEDGDYYTRTFYSFEDKPQEDGYWRALENGEPTRKIRPINVLSVEGVTITSQNDCPYDVKRGIELTSKRMPDASTGVQLPPAEVFSFDIEALEEEMAAA